MSNTFLSEERARLGLKSNKIAEFTGISIPQQSRYETGKRFPDTKYLAKLAELGFDIQFVVTGKRNDNVLTTEERFLLQKFREADKNKQNIALGLLMMDENNLLKAAAGDLSKGSKVTVGDDNSGNVAGSDIKT